jgi:hypothetical protein
MSRADLRLHRFEMGVAVLVELLVRIAHGLGLTARLSF